MVLQTNTGTAENINILIETAPPVVEVNVTYQDFLNDMRVLAEKYIFYNGGEPGDIDYNDVDRFLENLSAGCFAPLTQDLLNVDETYVQQIQYYICANFMGNQEHVRTFLESFSRIPILRPQCRICEEDAWDEGLCPDCLFVTYGVHVGRCLGCQITNYLNDEGVCPSC